MLPVSPTTLLVPTARRPAVRRYLQGLIWLAGIGAAGCFKPDDGREPPLDRIYFPTGIALSPDGNRLYLANSDWDLQFNAGSVQVYDTQRLRELLPQYCESDTDCTGNNQRCDAAPRVDSLGVATAPTYACVDIATEDPCQGLGLQTAAERLISPGLCQPLDNRDPDLLLDSVGIGAFATDLIYRSNPLGGGRLFVPVRSDATLHWIDVRGGNSPADVVAELDCGQGTGGECDADHRRGDGDGEKTPTGEELPIEPFGVDATTDGTAIVTTHQTRGQVSLFINDWQGANNGPRLSFILGGLPARPVVVRAIPVPEVARLDLATDSPLLGYRQGFWLAFRGTPFIQLIRYYANPEGPTLPFLEQAYADRLSTTQVSDIRGMAVDASARTACEVGCSDNSDCLTECAGIALEVFMANDPPPLTGSSQPLVGLLMIGNSTSTRRAEVPNDRLQVSDLVAIDRGPSRTVMGHVIDEQGQPQRRVFVTSFDSRSVTIYDPDARVVEARVLTGRGPTALAIDGVNGLAYVAHFTDSFVGVIDLDRRHKTFGTVLRALGRATAPRGDN